MTVMIPVGVFTRVCTASHNVRCYCELALVAACLQSTKYPQRFGREH
jgi:hypothetical protein